MRRKNKTNARRPKPKRSVRGLEILSVRGNVVPDTLRTHLNYKDQELSRFNAAGAQFSVFYLRFNNLFDMDPLLGTGSVSGFNELCALYTKYRVIGADIEWELGNFGAAPIYAYYYPSVTLTVPATVQGAISQAETPFAVPVRMAAPVNSTPNIVHFTKRHVELSSLFGNPREYYSNEDYVGVATNTPAGPTTSLYLIFVAYSSNNWSYNLNSNIKLRLRTEFFGKYPQAV